MNSWILFCLITVGFMPSVHGDCCSGTVSLTAVLNQATTINVDCTTGTGFPSTCEWIITSASGSRIGVVISSVQLSGSDTVTIFDSDDITELTEITSSGSMPLVPSSSNRTTVRLTGDGSLVGNEGTFTFVFAAAVTNTEATTSACNGTAENIELSSDSCISSPSFPDNYPASSMCSWNVSPASSIAFYSYIVVIFNLEVKDSGSCVDFLNITGRSQVFCGTELSTGDSVSGLTSATTFEFVSDGSQQSTGFLICFQTMGITTSAPTTAVGTIETGQATTLTSLKSESNGNGLGPAIVLLGVSLITVALIFQFAEIG